MFLSELPPHAQEYAPAKWRHGHPHPHPVVESTSLAAVAPPDIKYKLHVNDAIAAGRLSIVQVRVQGDACHTNGALYTSIGVPRPQRVAMQARAPCGQYFNHQNIIILVQQWGLSTAPDVYTAVTKQAELSAAVVA